MGTTGSVDGAGRLVIRGRFQQKQVENVLRRYIGTPSCTVVTENPNCLFPTHHLVEYVTCKTCRSLDTLLTKENRIFFMACESCGSRRSVNAIKSGFQAQVGKRSKNKTGWSVEFYHDVKLGSDDALYIKVSMKRRWWLFCTSCIIFHRSFTYMQLFHDYSFWLGST